MVLIWLIILYMHGYNGDIMGDTKWLMLIGSGKCREVSLELSSHPGQNQNMPQQSSLHDNP